MLAQYAHSVSAEGIVDPSSTNYFGHFLLTTTLLPQLKAAASEEGSDVRVVMVRINDYLFRVRGTPVDNSLNTE